MTATLTLPNRTRLRSLVPVLDRFLEAVSVAQKWRKLGRLQGGLERAMAAAFRAQGRAFVQEFSQLRPRFDEALRQRYLTRRQRAQLREAITESDWFSLFDAAAQQTLTMFLSPIQETAQAALLMGAADLIAQVGVDVAFNLRNPRAVAYLDAHGAELVTRINETTRSDIKRIVTQAVDEGWSYNRTAREITNRYQEFAVGKPQLHIDSRAHLVAVTESGMAYEEGSAIVVRDLQDAGLQMEKSWLTVGDDRVSDGCRANQAEGWIPMSQAHQSGHMQPLRFPGCRCTELYRRAKGAVAIPQPVERDLRARADALPVDVQDKIREWYQRGEGNDEHGHLIFSSTEIEGQKRQIAHSLWESLPADMRQKYNVTEADVSEFVHQWAVTSNDEDLRSLHIQKLASKKFDAPFSKWQNRKYKDLVEERYEDYAHQVGPSEVHFPMEFSTDWKVRRALDVADDLTNQIMDGMYEQTQQQFRESNIQEITLYRGIILEPNRIGSFNIGDVIGIEGNALESWSFDKAIADDFAGGYGITLQVTIPTDRILSTSRSGFGCLQEWEAVVIGREGDTAKLLEVFK